MVDSDSYSLYGLVAEFDTEEQLLDAVGKAYEAGYQQLDAYSPFFMEGLAEAFGQEQRNWLEWILLGGLLVGGLVGFGVQYYSRVIAYPINIGGRPFNSWPAFMLVTVILAILAASIALMLGLFLITGLPDTRQPIFSVPRFDLSRQDRFFLYIPIEDPLFDLTQTRQFLQSLDPLEVSEIDR